MGSVNQNTSRTKQTSQLLLGVIFRTKEVTVTLITIGVGLSFYLIEHVFFSAVNINVLLTYTPELGIPALGVTVLMIAGEFDLSVGSVFALTPLIIVALMDIGVNVWASIFLSLVFASLIGFTHGVITVKAKIPSFITTLGGLFVWGGLALIITGGLPRYFYMPQALIGAIGTQITLFVNSQLLWFVGLTFILFFVLEKSKYGNWIYATGGNKEAAISRGINTDRVKIVSFMLSSLLSGFGGLIEAARTAQALPTSGQSLPFDTIAAAVIGGTSLFGGAGTVIGTFVAEFLTRFIQNGLVIIGVQSFYFQVYLGIVIVIAVIANEYVRRRGRELRK
jgi:simple sugar transport system permease protein